MGSCNPLEGSLPSTQYRTMRFFKSLALLFLISSVSARLGEEDDAHTPRYLAAPKHSNKIKNQYIVKVEKGAKAKGLLHALMKNHPHAEVLHEFHSVFLGFAIKGIPEAAMRNLARKNPDVILSVEEDQVVQSSQVIWNLDRIDDLSLPLDATYSLPSGLDGSGVDIYIIDSGVRTSHSEFSGRIGAGKTYVGTSVNDQNGHGTHVAGTFSKIPRINYQDECMEYSQKHPFSLLHSYGSW